MCGDGDREFSDKLVKGCLTDIGDFDQNCSVCFCAVLRVSNHSYF